MKSEKLIDMVKNIVQQARMLKDKHTSEKDAPVNYACVFSQNKGEYNQLIETAQKIGEIIMETPTGFLFNINPIKTVSGDLKLLKIRIPDPTRTERGDADFTISDFSRFEKKYLTKKGFKLMPKKNFT